MHKTISSVVRIGRSWSLLEGSLRSLYTLVVGSRRLLRVRRWVWIVHEVARRSKAGRVWLLLLRSLSLALSTALCLVGEDRIGERRRGSGIGSIRECRAVIIQVEIEPVATVVTIHLVCRCRSLSPDFEGRLKDRVAFVPQLLFRYRSQNVLGATPLCRLGCRIEKASTLSDSHPNCE